MESYRVRWSKQNELEFENLQESKQILEALS